MNKGTHASKRDNFSIFFVILKGVREVRVTMQDAKFILPRPCVPLFIEGTYELYRKVIEMGYP